jgi:hypothetical protein
MLVMRTTENPTDSVGKLLSTQQTVGLDHFALAVNHLGSIAFSHGLCLAARRRQSSLLRRSISNLRKPGMVSSPTRANAAHNRGSGRLTGGEIAGLHFLVCAS